MQPGSSPAPPLGESTFRPPPEADPGIAREDVITTYNSEPYELLPRWLKELQRKPYDTFLIGKEPAPIHQKNVGEALESKTPAESNTVAANSPGDRPKSEKPDADPVPEPVVEQSEKTDGPPQTTSKETIARAETGVAADTSSLPVNPGTVATGTVHTEKATSEEIAAARTPELSPPLPLKQKETDPGSRKKPDETDVSGNESIHAPASERKEPIAQQNADLATSQRSGLETQLKNEQVKWFMIVVNPEEKQDGLQWGKYARLNPPQDISTPTLHVMCSEDPGL
jgi:hypothetical protein